MKFIIEKVSLKTDRVSEFRNDLYSNMQVFNNVFKEINKNMLTKLFELYLKPKKLK